MSAPPQSAPNMAPMATTPMTQQLDLRDIRAPGEPSPWPPAPGWWLLAALLVLIAVVVGRRLRQIRRRARLRRSALAELDRWREVGSAPVLAAGVSALLKRAALNRFPNPGVAALTGDAWLDFLDHTGGEGRFQQGPGRLLAEAPYAPSTALDPKQSAALIDLARAWLRRNL